MSTMSRPHHGSVMVITRPCSHAGMPVGARFRILSEAGMGFVLCEKLSHYTSLDAGWEDLYARTRQLPRYIVMKTILSLPHDD